MPRRRKKIKNEEFPPKAPVRQSRLGGMAGGDQPLAERIKNDNAESGNQAEDKKSGKIKLEVRIKKARPVKNEFLNGEKKKQKSAPVEKNILFSAPKEKVKKVVDPEKAERDKRMIMWSGIAFFMVLIVGFWFYNISSIFRASTPTSKSASEFDWNKIKDEFKKVTEQMKQNLAELKKVQAPVGQNILSESEDSAGQNEINLLKQRLLEEVASSTIATSTIK